jgi:hypothetical protein
MFKWLILWCCFVNFQVNFCLVCVSVCLVEEVLISTCLAAVIKLSKNRYWPFLSQRHFHFYKINKVYLSCESSKLCQFQHLKNVDNLFCLLWCPDFMFPPKTCLVPIQSNFGLSLCWRGCQFLPIHFSLTLSVAKVKSGLTSSAQQSLASSYQIQYFFHSLTQFATLTCFLSLFLSLLHAITHSLSLSLFLFLYLSRTLNIYIAIDLCDIALDNFPVLVSFYSPTLPIAHSLLHADPNSHTRKPQTGLTKPGLSYQL